MFENKQVGCIYATRFIASWVKVGGTLRYGKDRDDFRKWLLSLGLNQNDVDHIVFLATTGKLELETDARKFLAKHTTE